MNNNHIAMGEIHFIPLIGFSGTAKINPAIKKAHTLLDTLNPVNSRSEILMD